MLFGKVKFLLNAGTFYCKQMNFELTFLYIYTCIYLALCRYIGVALISAVYSEISVCIRYPQFVLYTL